MSGIETTLAEHAVEPSLKGQTDSKKAKLSKDDQKPIPAQSAPKDRDPLSEWPLILKAVKAQRESLYSLLTEVKVQLGDKNDLILAFLPEREFNAELVGRENNRKFLEDLISKSCGRQFVLKLIVKQIPKPDRQSMSENSLVRKAYDLFGKENVEIIDD